MDREGPVWLVLLGICFALAKGQRCEPSCFGHDVSDLVANPRNCSQYYACREGSVPSEFPSDCNTDMIFDPAIGGCVPGDTCEHTCPPCHLTCISVGDHISDPFDCSVFYVCDINGPGPVKKCPTDYPHFDGSFCVDDKSVCCNPGCSPYCEHPSIHQVPDPLDCTSFYTCVDSVPQNRQTCETDRPVFDYTFGECSSTAACELWCPTNTNSSTTTTEGPPECLGSYLCTEVGVFPVCPYCFEYYFLCEALGQYAVIQKCSEYLVFNPDPSNPYCVFSFNCPSMLQY